MSKGRRRGGKGGAEPPARILERRWRAWELAVRGWTQREIAEALGVSQPAVSKMVRRAGLDACEELREQSRAHLARQSSQLDYVFRESIEAWEKSKSDHTRRRHQRVEGTAADAVGVAKTVAEAVATTREGDPRFLATALQALREKREALTLVGPAEPATSLRPGADPWAATTAWLATLTTEELRVLDKVATNRVMAGSGFEHPPLAREALDSIREAVILREGEAVPATAPGGGPDDTGPQRDGRATHDDD